jgi:hypothetical protein
MKRDHPAMIPRRLRVLFSEPSETTDFDAPAVDDEPAPPPPLDEVAFVAYGEDCILSGRTFLDADRLSDMLNGHDEYALIGVTVQRLDDGTPVQVDEVVVPRDELILVHASGPRGDAARRHRTQLQHVALKMGPYQVRGFLHALPGADPVAAMRRRKPMVPLTNVRIEFTFNGETREDRVETVIVNREQIDWVEVVEPDRVEFPVRSKPLSASRPKTT